MEDGAGEAFGNRELIFEAADHQGALRQDGAVGAGQTDAVEFVTAYGSRAAGAEHQAGRHFFAFAGVNVACLPADDECTDFFVFRREEIACACRSARHLGGGEEFAQGRADFAVEVVAVLRMQLGFDALPFP